MKTNNETSPAHYKLGKLPVEAKDVIDYVTDHYTGSAANDLGNVLKYLLRAHNKGGLTDLKKAQKYLTWLIEKMDKKDNSIKQKRKKIKDKKKREFDFTQFA